MIIELLNNGPSGSQQKSVTDKRVTPGHHYKSAMKNSCKYKKLNVAKWLIVNDPWAREKFQDNGYQVLALPELVEV